MKNRLPWNEYFMQLAELVATRSTCDRAEVGAVIVNEDRRIVSTGYNGNIAGNPHCDDVGHTMRNGHCIATIHAEMNAILYCAKKGVAVDGCIIYVTHFPCLECTKALIQVGIKAIYYRNEYRVDDYALQLLQNNNVPYKKI